MTPSCAACALSSSTRCTRARAAFQHHKPHPHLHPAQPIHTPPKTSNRSRPPPPLHTTPHHALSPLVPARQVKALAAARLEGEALPAVLESESRLAHETTRLLRELDEARAELAATAVRLHSLQQGMHAVEEQKVRTPDCSP